MGCLLGVSLAVRCACPLTARVRARSFRCRNVSVRQELNGSRTETPTTRERGQEGGGRHLAIGDVPLPEGIQEKPRTRVSGQSVESCDDVVFKRSPQCPLKHLRSRPQLWA